jgi:hypothetical protein
MVKEKDMVASYRSTQCVQDGKGPQLVVVQASGSWARGIQEQARDDQARLLKVKFALSPHCQSVKTPRRTSI